MAERGEVSLQDACYISTSYRWERACGVYQAMLRRMADAKGRPLSTDQQISCIERMAKCSEHRDRAVSALRLRDRHDRGDLNAIFATAVTVPQPPANGVPLAQTTTEMASGEDAADGGTAAPGKSSP